MKRKLVLTSAVVLILALLAAGTFAYFTKDARATNVITTGTIDITLNDEIRGGEKTGTGWKASCPARRWRKRSPSPTTAAPRPGCG